jgi:hypothetical protein
MLVAIEKSHMMKMKLPNKSKETYKLILSNLHLVRDHHSLIMDGENQVHRPGLTVTTVPILWTDQEM